MLIVYRFNDCAWLINTHTGQFTEAETASSIQNNVACVLQNHNNSTIFILLPETPPLKILPMPLLCSYMGSLSPLLH